VKFQISSNNPNLASIIGKKNLESLLSDFK